MTAFIPRSGFFPSRLAGDCSLLLLLLSLIPAARSQQASIGGRWLTPAEPLCLMPDQAFACGRAPDGETQSGDSGEFGFSNVPAGAYRMTFTANGFAAKTIKANCWRGKHSLFPRPRWRLTGW